MSAEFEKHAYQRFEEFDEKFKKIDERFDKIDERFEKIDERFEKIDDTLEGIQETLEVMKRSIILIEDQVSVKIPALFDGYAMHQQKQEILEKDINSLNRKVENHDIRISILEQHSI